MGSESGRFGYPLAAVKEIARAARRCAPALHQLSSMAESARPALHARRSLRVMARLRDPDTGCPWDREQSFATSRHTPSRKLTRSPTRSRANDLDGAQGRARRSPVAGRLSRAAWLRKTDASPSPTWSMPSPRKMIRRHPHVFEDASLRDAFLTSGTWERIKAEEKACGAASGDETRRGRCSTTCRSPCPRSPAR